MSTETLNETSEIQEKILAESIITQEIELESTIN